MKKVLSLLPLVVLFGVSAALLFSVFSEPNKSQPVSETSECRLDAEKLLEYINQERLTRGAVKLKVDTALSISASSRLEGMIEGRYFSHEMPGDAKWWDSIRAQGVRATVSEDLGFNDVTAKGSWDEFKNSPDHYKSLVEPSYTRVGISTRCTDYEIKTAVVPSDKEYIGTVVSDLTVIHLAAPEPKN